MMTKPFRSLKVLPLQENAPRQSGLKTITIQTSLIFFWNPVNQYNQVLGKGRSPGAPRLQRSGRNPKPAGGFHDDRRRRLVPVLWEMNRNF
jgi:hypothetical protein